YTTLFRSRELSRLGAGAREQRGVLRSPVPRRRFALIAGARATAGSGAPTPTRLRSERSGSGGGSGSRQATSFSVPDRPYGNTNSVPINPQAHFPPSCGSLPTSLNAAG